MHHVGFGLLPAHPPPPAAAAAFQFAPAPLFVQGPWPFARRGLAVTAAARSEHQPEQQRQGAEIEGASLRHGPALFAGWAALAGTAASVALARQVPPDLVLLVVSLPLLATLVVCVTRGEVGWGWHGLAAV